MNSEVRRREKSNGKYRVALNLRACTWKNLAHQKLQKSFSIQFGIQCVLHIGKGKELLITVIKSKSNLLILFPNKLYQFQVTKKKMDSSHSRFDFPIGYSEDNKLTNSVEVVLEQHILKETKEKFFQVNTAYPCSREYGDYFCTQYIL